MSESEIKTIVLPPCPPGYNPQEWHAYHSHVAMKEEEKKVREGIDSEYPVLGVFCILFVPVISLIWGLLAAILGRKYAAKMIVASLLSWFIWWVFLSIVGMR